MDAKIFKKVLSYNPSEEDYIYWKRMLVIYLEKALSHQQISPADSKLEALFVLFEVKAFTLIQDSTSFDEAITILDLKFQKRSTAIMMHHKLRLLKQHEGESVENFMCNLKQFARKCPTQSLTADQHRNLLICDAFIAEVYSQTIRQRLREYTEDNIDVLYKTALTMELAAEDALNLTTTTTTTLLPNFAATKNPSIIKLCFWCGDKLHPKAKCPERNSTCTSCQRKNHNEKYTDDEDESTLLSSAIATINSPSRLIDVIINKNKTQAIILLLNINNGRTVTTFFSNYQL
ncbi:uncharacterized protein LOC136089621 [Hydra vulgaris]|uniref:Uncharacterized protein LOC136089621 n=1 Tax=Hydra vulgaris TaxID=6087 RepID=A0ABM4DBM0_HYDVU